MKKLLLLIIAIMLIPLFACEPVPHEECIEDWTLKIEDRPLLIISKTTYIVETEHGDVVVSKKIYETALEDGYEEICVLVEKGNETKLVGATRIDGTPEDNELIEEITDQIINEEEGEN